MKAEVLSGRPLSNLILNRIQKQISHLPRPPTLAVVVVGNRYDSCKYISVKQKAAAACQIQFRLIQLPTLVSQYQLHQTLYKLSKTQEIDAIILQLPLPPHLRVRPALCCIHPSKDVDGLHPINAGNLFLKDKGIYTGEILLKEENENKQKELKELKEEKYFVPCTAMAVRALLFSYLNKISYNNNNNNNNSNLNTGKKNLHAVIMNTSMVVGIPTAALLQKENNITVTLCNRSNNIEAIKQLSQQADIIITALGIPKIITGEFIKPGAIVIDVAINEDKNNIDNNNNINNNKTDSPSSRRRVCGDVDIDSVINRAAAITPVPGGVGPMTVAYLMQNTLKAYLLSEEKKENNNYNNYNNKLFASFEEMYNGNFQLNSITSTQNSLSFESNINNNNNSSNMNEPNNAFIEDNNSENQIDNEGDNSSFEVC